MEQSSVPHQQTIQVRLFPKIAVRNSKVRSLKAVSKKSIKSGGKRPLLRTTTGILNSRLDNAKHCNIHFLGFVVKREMAKWKSTMAGR